MGVEALTFKRSLQGARAPVIDEAVTGGEVKHGAKGSAAVRRALEVGLPIVLAGYALLDRAFAYEAAVPGTPIRNWMPTWRCF